MKAVTFNLGLATGLSARQLTITRQARAGEDPTGISAQHDADAGAVATVVVNLPDNEIWSAKLVDTLSADSSTRTPQYLNFHTGSLQYLTHKASQPEGSQLFILHMEDLSSSSSSSASSSSSS